MSAGTTSHICVAIRYAKMKLAEHYSGSSRQWPFDESPEYVAAAVEEAESKGWTVLPPCDHVDEKTGHCAGHKSREAADAARK